MVNKVKILIPNEIPNLDKYIDIESVKEELYNHVRIIIANINIQDLGDWQLLINVLAQRTDAIGVSKRVARFPSDKENVIYMSIPIPDDEQALYGLSIVKEAFFKAINEKYSYIIKPEFNCYTTLYQYFLESSKRAIDMAFTHGFTCNGKKIVLQK